MPLCRAIHKKIVLTDKEFLLVRNGKERVVALSAAPILGEHGTIVGGVAIWRDITENKHHSESTLSTIIEALPVAVVTADAQGRLHLGSWELDLVTNRFKWSDEIYRIFGLRPHGFDATYKAFLDHVHPEDRAAVDAAYSGSVREGRDSYEIEHRVIRKNTGHIRFVHEKCYHVRDVNGQIVRSIGMVHDITEHQFAEEQIRQKAELLENANSELERFNRIAVGREMRMIELKREVNALCVRLGEPPRYSLEFIDSERRNETE